MVLLENGGMPLNVLETVVSDWITQEKSSRSGVKSNTGFSCVIYVTALVWLLLY